tara:strand:+ start:1173 stop:2345 length:1173 start_codon:yes stop_codon:yes gene_type:complete
MNSSYLPYGKQTVTQQDIDSVIEVLKSPFITQGPKIEAFEKAVSQSVGSLHAIATNSATSALHLACLAVGLGKGDWLWTTPTTFVASANCALYCGANVDFVDIDPLTGLISISELEKKLELAKKRGNLPKVLVPVHLCGTPCDMKYISKLANIYGFIVIEDASHAIGASYEDHKIGNCAFSKITIFSFHPVKIITTGEGGMAMTNDNDLASEMTKLRSHGIVKNQNYFIEEPAGVWSYEQQLLGYNYRITDIQAALGISQLKRLDQIVTERRRILSTYRENLNKSLISLLKVPPNVKTSAHLAVVRLIGLTQENHKRVFEQMREQKIGVQLHYQPVHLQPFYKRMGFKIGDFPESEMYATSAISLPIYPGLTDSSQDRVISTIEKIINNL